jgi:hypothetical protein
MVLYRVSVRVAVLMFELLGHHNAPFIGQLFLAAVRIVPKRRVSVFTPTRTNDVLQRDIVRPVGTHRGLLGVAVCIVAALNGAA